MVIRDAIPAELPVVSDIRISAYVAGGHLSENSGYATKLRALGLDGNGHVLVAVDPGGYLVGTVMLQFWPHAGTVVTGPDEAEVRALAVSPRAQGAGIGTALLRGVIDRAIDVGVRHLVLWTQDDMLTAHRLYDQAGFIRLPDRDKVTDSGVTLIAYGLRLDPALSSPATG